METSAVYSARMVTNKLQASGRRPASAKRQRIKPLLPETEKFTTALKGEEQILARGLARVIAVPGQQLTVQDILRIGLAQLGVLHAEKLIKGTDRA